MAGRFLQQQSMPVHPVFIQNHPGHTVYYILFGLLTLLAFIRFFYPSALTSLFSLFWGRASRRDEDNYSRPGWFVPLFLTVNFIVGFSLLVLVLLIRWQHLPAKTFSDPHYWVVITGGIILFYLFLQTMHFLAGVVFDTMKEASLQIKNTALWIYVSGIFLTPLLLIYFYSGREFIVDITVALLGLLLLLKWVQTFRIGLSLKGYHPLHIFLYLCTVEIVPLLLLVKTGTG
jgi:uncharacterized membrane protein YdcZ (DUF606 family)